MKHILATILALLVFTGCTTTREQQRLTDEMVSVAEVAAFVGTSVHLIDNPTDRVYFRIALNALNAALADHDYDPAGFAEILSELPMHEIQGDKGAVIVGTAVILWERYSRQIVALDTEETVKPVMIAVRDGINRALN